MDNTQILIALLAVTSLLQGIAIHARERRARLKSEKLVSDLKSDLNEQGRNLFEAHNDVQRFEDAVRDTHVVEYRTTSEGRAYIYSITRRLVEKMDPYLVAKMEPFEDGVVRFKPTQKPFKPNSFHLEVDEEELRQMEQARQEIDALPIHVCGVCCGEFPEELTLVYQASGPMRCCMKCLISNNERAAFEDKVSKVKFYVPCAVCGFETPEDDLRETYQHGIATKACSTCILSDQRVEEYDIESTERCGRCGEENLPEDLTEFGLKGGIVMRCCSNCVTVSNGSISWKTPIDESDPS